MHAYPMMTHPMIYPGYGCGGGYGKGWGKDQGKDWGYGGFPMKGGFKGGQKGFVDDDGMGMWVYMGDQGGMGGKGPMVPMGGRKGQFHGVGVPSGKNRQPPRKGTQKGEQNAKKKGEKRKAEAGPLDESIVAQIAEFLTANGGAISLGKLTTEFSGLRKAQVLEHFAIVEAADRSSGDALVTLDGVDPSLFTDIVAGQAKAKKVKTSKDPNAPPPAELEQHIIDEITQKLSDNGGTSSLGRLTSLFPGIKKAQLEPHFEVSFGEKDSSVSLFGGPTEVAEAAAEEAPKPKKKKKERDPNAPPPPDLAMSVVEQIGAYVESVGGSVSLGKVTGTFPGVKKVQLEGHFVVTARAGADAVVSML